MADGMQQSDAGPGGQGGGTPSAPIDDPKRAKAEAALVVTALGRGWDVPNSLRERVLRWAAATLNSEQASDRDKAAAAKVALAADAHNLKLAEFLDKTARLDNGQDTERVGVKLLDREAWEQA